MKKILMVLFLSLVGFTNAFTCESVFDHIDGITCELQYRLCSEFDQDIKVCREVKDKVKRLKKDIKEVNKKIDKLESDYEKAKKADETYKTFNLILNKAKLDTERSKIYEDFIGTEVLQMLESKKFVKDVDEVLQKAANK